MSVNAKRRLTTIAAALPPDRAQECCLNLERAKAYADLVHQRFDEGAMSEATVEFWPDCSKNASPCPEGCRYVISLWRNVARLEHLRDLDENLMTEG